jgi:FMN reductase
VRFDPAGRSLPFPEQEGSFPDLDVLREVMNDAVGVVIATPEYHGSFPAMLKLILENMGFPSALRGKPVALLGVAAGRIGAIKSLEQLRSVCSHTGAFVLPSTVSIAGVNRVFDESGKCTDEGTERSVRSVAQNLTDYIHHHICPGRTLEAMMREPSASS